MKKILFTNKFGLLQPVFSGKKTQTRRIATFENIDEPNIGTGIEGKVKGRKIICRGLDILAESRYCIGEVVAIAQPYFIVNIELAIQGKKKNLREDYERTAGWKNALYVRADEMPHHIKMMRIRVERLQDISDGDCLKEGVQTIKSEDVPQIDETGVVYYSFKGVSGIWTTPQGAFAAMIDKVCGKDTWKRNPFVFVYDFKLID